jgi:hypothetical protein
MRRMPILSLLFILLLSMSAAGAAAPALGSVLSSDVGVASSGVGTAPSGVETAAPGDGGAAGLRLEVSFTAAAHAGPVTGRVLVAISRTNQRAPIQQAGTTGVPLFGVDVEGLAPGRAAFIDGTTFGHPLAGLDELPAGEYWVQAFINVYTECRRADGHTVWVHLDRWEGQNWRRSPGNLFSNPVQVRIDPAAGGTVRLVCDQVVPEVQMPADTDYVKHFRIQSRILSEWWGQPIYLGAVVLLPKGYETHPDVHYPVNYGQGHFSLGAPGGFGRGGEFDRYWKDPDTPRWIWVTLQHPSPYYDDSYGVDSENNGPYGRAITEELIPEIERRFRTIPEPWARLLSGGSTGGWISLAYQIFYPDLFGGVWSSCPDPVDFRYHQIVDIYKDANAYWLEMGWTRVERPNQRQTDGSVRSMMKDENLYELVVGDHSRSGGQWDIWEATFSPVGADGYPQRIWDKRTGVIDHATADWWREHWDLRYILERDWSVLGPKLVGRLHVYVGDMDSYYLNDGVHLLETFLESTSNPYYQGEVAYGPRAPHGWGPRGQELVEKMTAHVTEYAPPGADLRSWRYR